MLKLNLDYDGKPEIEIYSNTVLGDTIEDKSIQIFIREAFKNGITIERSCGEKTCDRHAVIKIKLAKED